MGNLLNKNIDQTYQGLINTSDEGVIGVTPKALTDGAGNTLPVQVGIDSMIYSGTQDFSGATLVGIADGTSGTSGTDGTSGSSGTDGTSGSSGTDGTSGSSGTSGTDGTSGITPASLTVGGFTDVTEIITGSNLTASEIAPGFIELSATGGGGGGVNMYNSIARPVNANTITTSNPFYKLNVPALTFSGASISPGVGGFALYPVYALVEGEIIDDVAIFVTTAQAGSQLELGLYSCSFDPSGKGTFASTLETTFGLVDSSTTGRKQITGLNYTIPASVNSFYYVGVRQDGGAASVAIFGPNNSATMSFYGALDATIMQRAISRTTTSATLPATISQAEFEGYPSTTATAFIGFK